MNKYAYLISFSALLAACNAEPAQPPLSEAPLAGATIGGPFELTDQNGKRRTDREFSGQYRLVYFGYTSCPDICTPDMQQLMAGLKQFEKEKPKLAAKIQPIFITVDPQRDTPEKLKEFVSAFHSRLIGLTGTETEIAATAKAYALSYQKMPQGDGPDYLMNHAQLPYLMGPKGEPLALLPADTPQSKANEGEPSLVAAELAKWVR
jgi:protein SCO1